MDVLYTKLKLDYRLSLWAPTSASRAISAVAEPLVWKIWRSSVVVTPLRFQSPETLNRSYAFSVDHVSLSRLHQP